MSVLKNFRFTHSQRSRSLNPSAFEKSKWFFKPFELSQPFELTCPCCGFLFAQFYPDGREEFYGPPFCTFDGADNIHLNPVQGKGGYLWYAEICWGTCHRCGEHFLGLEMTASKDASDFRKGSHFFFRQTDGIPKFGISSRARYPKAKAMHRNLLAFHTHSEESLEGESLGKQLLPARG